MRLFEFYLIEDYPSSAKRLIAQGADPAEVEAALDFHKKWKNSFKPEWKDIDKVNDWAGFKQFIDKERIDRNIKDEAKQHDQVVLRDDAEWLIVVPLKHSTSCFHGSNTDWCTTKLSQDHFSHYFFEANIILIYCIKHADPKKLKWAVALHMDQLNNTEFFDIRDSHLEQDQFEAQTGLKFRDLVAGVRKNLNYIDQQREHNKEKDLSYLLDKAVKVGQRNTYLERLIIINKNANAAVRYTRNVTQGRWPEAEPFIIKTPETAWLYTWAVIKGRWPEAEPMFAKIPDLAVHYAKLIGQRFPEAEPELATRPFLALKYAIAISQRFPEAELAIAKVPELAVAYARYVFKKRWPEAEPAIVQNPKEAIKYARFVIKKRWPEAEPNIAKDLASSIEYAKRVVKGRWLDMESTFLKTPLSAYTYATKVVKGRWPEGEPVIMKNVKTAYDYANKIIKGPWPEAEPVFATKPKTALAYALNIIKGRFPKAETYISQDPEQAYMYAHFVLEKRWPEAEPVIAKGPSYISTSYAKYVLKDRDPFTWAERYLAKQK